MAYRQLIECFYDAYIARDEAAVVALYHMDGWHEEVATGQRRVGHEALAQGLTGFWQMFPDVVWVRAGLVRAGNHLAVPYQMRASFTPRSARHEGEEKLDKSNKVRFIALDGLHLFELRDGLLAATKDMWDLDHFKAQIS